MNRSLLLLMAISLLLGGQSFASAQEDTLARIGAAVITSREVRERLELMPFPGKENPRLLDSTKLRGVYALMAERLLAGEAHRQDLQEDPVTKRMREGLESLLLRDAFYRSEVQEKVTLSAAEIREGLKRFSVTLRLVAFQSPNREAAQTLTRTLVASGALDEEVFSAAKELFFRKDTITLTLGGGNEEWEQTAFSLTETNRAATVSLESNKWVVLFLLGKTESPASKRVKPEDHQRRVEQILRGQKEDALALRVYESVLGEKTAQTNPMVFLRVGDSLTAFWKRHPSIHSEQRGYLLPSESLDRFIEDLGDVAGQTFVRWPDDSLTVAATLEMFRYKEFSSKDSAGPAMRGALNARIKEVVGDKLLSLEGKRRLLQNSDRFVHDLRRWTDYWSARTLLYRILDTVRVNDADVYEHVLRNREYFGPRYEVNVREILSVDRAGAIAALEMIHAGRTFAGVARERTVRQEWAACGGESGFFPVSLHLELGLQALAADSGVLTGPVMLPEGASLFYVIGKRSVGTSSFDMVSKVIRERLAGEKRKASVNNYVARLAGEQGISINTTNILRMTIQPAQMFTRRRIGFGGTMTAVPLFLQQWDWVKQLPSADLQLP